jgi:ABC-2 type transport system permease protein
MLIFIVPALTMRLLAEEKKLRTYDLLLTSPVTSLEIVAGKYLAVLGAIVGIIVISLLYPIVTSLMASVQWVPLLVSFFGIFLVAAVYAAMNLFCSALTESIIVAYVMSVIFNVAIWFIGVGVEVVDSPTARQIFEHISLNNHLSGLVEGTIRSSGLVFFISVIALFGFLAERVVESSRWR